MQSQALGKPPFAAENWSEKPENGKKRVLRVEFERQPPPDIRKSNFFSFKLGLVDNDNAPVEVKLAEFVGFISQPDRPEDQPSCNGVRYRLELIFADGVQVDYVMDVNLVDSLTKEIICYEGQDKNPDMRRVLLTHEVMCRCTGNKSCGNKNETPSDPVIDRSSPSFLTFHVKCNQNCINKAGNPKIMRRFRIQVASQGDCGRLLVLAFSDQLFVHNNSKHKTPTKRAQVKCDTGIARLEALIPRFQGDPEKLNKEEIINRAADALESFRANPFFASGPQGGYQGGGPQGGPHGGYQGHGYQGGGPQGGYQGHGYQGAGPQGGYHGGYQGHGYQGGGPQGGYQANRIIVNGTTGALPSVASLISMPATVIPQSPALFGSYVSPTMPFQRLKRKHGETHTDTNF